MQSDLILRRPREDEEEEFLRAHRATSPDVPSFLHYYIEGMPFRRYLEVLAEQEQGINLPSAQHVPSTFLFANVGPGSRACLDSTLTERVSRARGRPHRLRRSAGVSTAGLCHTILHLSLQIAREKCRGTHRILATCDDDNPGSIRTIEKNGGVLENIVSGPDVDKPKRRYWIDIGTGTDERLRTRQSPRVTQSHATVRHPKPKNTGTSPSAGPIATCGEKVTVPLRLMKRNSLMKPRCHAGDRREHGGEEQYA